MGDLGTQLLAILGSLGTIASFLLWRRQGRNIDADTRVKLAQAEVALSADARAWVEQYADQARDAQAEAKEARHTAEKCQGEVRALRAYLVEVEQWARRNMRPDAEPMPRMVWPLPDPRLRPID